MTEVRPTGPPFLRLGAGTTWQTDLGDAPGIAEVGGALTLGRPGRDPIPVAEPFGSFGGRTLVRGLALGPDGRLFLADPGGRVVLSWQVGTPGGDGRTAPFEPLWGPRPLEDGSDPYLLVRPTDVGVSPAGDLVIADPGAGRLLVLALPTARLRHVVALRGWAPTALAFDHSGHAYVADPALATVHRFDRAWRRDPRFPHRTVALSAPVHVAATGCRPTRDQEQQPCSCGCSRGSSRGPVIVVLDGRQVVGLDARGLEVSMTELPPLTPPPPQRGDAGVLVLRDPSWPRRDPLRITGLALDRDGLHTNSRLPLLAVARHTVLPRAGTFTVTALDGGHPGFAWDRLVLRAQIPTNTRILVSTLTNDSPVERDRLDQQPPEAWSRPLAVGPGDSPELLVQTSGGRYLWARFELFGDGSSTPVIRGIDVFGPRASSVRHLPPPFHQDPESWSFLDRFLAYFDTVFAEITATNASMAALLDPRAAPPGRALDWLGSWFDLTFLAQWPPDLRRRMVSEAVAYYRERGTVHGLKRVIQWHTGLSDPLPQVIEHFHVPVAADGTTPFIGGQPLDASPVAHGCTIVLPERVVPDEDERRRLERLVAEHIPGHVRFHLRLVPAGVAVGRQSTVGVDTLLGTPTSAVLGQARLGQLVTPPGARDAVVIGHSLPHGRRPT